MSLPPVEIPLGAMRFNSDSQKLEYFNGDVWMQVHTFNPDLNGGPRGIWAGGSTPTVLATIDYINIASAGNAADFGDLNEVKSEGAASSSNTKGIFAGGYNGPSRTGNTSYIIIPTTGFAADYNDLTSATNIALGFGNQTRGFAAGGKSPANTNVIEYTTIASNSDWKDFGDSTAAHISGSGCATPTRGVYNLGYVTPTRVNTIDYINITSLGDAQDFGDLTTNRNGTGALSNSIRGIWGAGETPSVVATMDYATLATTGNAVEFGDMLSGRFNIPNDGASSPTRGVWGGGASPSNSDVIQYITIATQGNGVDFGNLTAAAQHKSALSNAHGGLG